MPSMERLEGDRRTAAAQPLSEVQGGQFAGLYKLGQLLYGGDFGPLGGPGQGVVSPGVMAFNLLKKGKINLGVLAGLKKLGIDLDKLGLGSAGLLESQGTRLHQVDALSRVLGKRPHMPPESIRPAGVELSLDPEMAINQARLLADRIGQIERRLEIDRPFAPNPLEVPVRLKPPADMSPRETELTEAFLNQIRDARLTQGDRPTSNILPELLRLREEEGISRNMSADVVERRTEEFLDLMRAQRSEKRAQDLRSLFKLIRNELDNPPPTKPPTKPGK